MDQICLVIPILAGKTGAARNFLGDVETERKAEYALSERRLGITKEVWFLAQMPAGDYLVAYMESRDFGTATQLFVKSQDDFDVWFKQRLAETTGVDMNKPPDPEMRLPELLSSYQA
jgi:hypothetical protein